MNNKVTQPPKYTDPFDDGRPHSSEPLTACKEHRPHYNIMCQDCADAQVELVLSRYRKDLR